MQVVFGFCKVHETSRTLKVTCGAKQGQEEGSICPSICIYNIYIRVFILICVSICVYQVYSAKGCINKPIFGA